MTSTNQGRAEREDERASSSRSAQADDPRAGHRAGKRAFKELTAPIRVSMTLAQVLGTLYGALAVAPYAILIQLGEVLLAAGRSGVSPDRGEVMELLMWLTGAFGLRYGIYFVALTLTHLADVRFGHIVRSRMVDVLAAAPLAWFTSTNSGAVRKAIQDDTHDVHTVIAHAPVESAAAVSAPLSLLVYSFVVDWRLGLLSVATVPIYGIINAWMMRGMGEKTVEMDRHLSRVSATMVEFVSGISVVKAFGTVGRAHERFTRAADDFSRFYVAWCGPPVERIRAGAGHRVPLDDPSHLDGGRGGARGRGRRQPRSGHHLRAHRPRHPCCHRGPRYDRLVLPDRGSRRAAHRRSPLRGTVARRGHRATRGSGRGHRRGVLLLRTHARPR